MFRKLLTPYYNWRWRRGFKKAWKAKPDNSLKTVLDALKEGESVQAVYTPGYQPIRKKDLEQ